MLPLPIYVRHKISQVFIIVVDLQIIFFLESFFHIQTKLEKFIKRYYLSALLRGFLLFFGLGLLYAIFWLLIEYFFWLPTVGRGFVFWSLVGFEAVLFYKLIALPLSKYLKIRKGLDNEDAAVLIGEAFPEINDKLLNTIQLRQQQPTELILASIEQKVNLFNPFSFERAVALKDNLKYIKYAIAPLLILAPFYLFGKQDSIEDSLKRMVDYSTVYTPPPPFVFQILNKKLHVIQGTNFNLRIKTAGPVLPLDVQIRFDNQTYYLKKQSDQAFTFEFSPLQKDTEFTLFSGDVISGTQQIKVIKAPKILGASLILDYPKYTNRNKETISNFGNVSVPEGTLLTWRLLTTSTDTISFFSAKKLSYFSKKENVFSFSKAIFKNTPYRISTTNRALRHYENLQFNIQAIKDLPPRIEVQSQRQNNSIERLFFYGQVSDDYGVSALHLNYYPKGRKDLMQIIELTDFNPTSLSFSYVFPNTLKLKPDTVYELYFEVFDNDPFPKANSSKSTVFSYRHKSQKTVESEQLEAQEEALKALEKSLPQRQKQRADLELLKQGQQQKEGLTFTDREKIKAILERQSQQDAILKNYNKKMKQSLAQTMSDAKDPERELLKKRLDAQNKQLERDEKLLNELKEVAKQLKKEDLIERIEKINQLNKSKQRSLEQMLELTKRYYVKQKAKQLKKRLEELSAAQKLLSEKEKEKNNAKSQEQLINTFKSLSESLEDLRKKNNDLLKPMSFQYSNDQKRSVQKDQLDAQKELQKKEEAQDVNEKNDLNKKAQKAQQKAAQKMLEMALQMAQKMTGGGQNQIQEDVDMLRQILDNLLLFSFEQEDLMLRFKSGKEQPLDYAANLIEQKNIKSHFEHIDDSLFVISLRQPLISDKVNRDISAVYYNIDKALNLFADGRSIEAVSAQQYAITSTNSLGDLLSNALDAMEMQMQMSPGQGEGDMQLPDIIMSQDDLKKQAENAQNKSGQEAPTGTESSTKEGDKGQGKEEEGQGQKGDQNGQSQGGKQAGYRKGSDQGSKGKNGSSGEFFDSEESSQALMRLYQQQQELRQSLEQLLRKKGYGLTGKSVIENMKKIEQSLINKGFTPEVLTQMQAMKYQFLKLENALKKQGIESRRRSNVNTDSFNSNAPLSPLDSLKKQFNSRDQLIRETLPLRQEYNKRVLEYFKPKYD